MKNKAWIGSVLGVMVLGGVVVGCKQLAEAAREAGADSKTVGLLDAGAKIQDGLSVDDRRREAIGQSVAVSLSSQKGIATDEALQEYVNLVGLTVAAASDKPDLVYTFGVLNSDDVNAYSAPGGYVFVTKGALKQMQDESELAGVLAHEVGHIIKDHSVNAIKGNSFWTGMAEGAAAMSDPGQQKELVKALGDATKTVIGRSFSQKEEYEADAEAIKILKNAGYDPTGLARFLARQPAQTAALSTHPRSADRLAKLAALAGGATGQKLADRYVSSVKVK